MQVEQKQRQKEILTTMLTSNNDQFASTVNISALLKKAHLNFAWESTLKPQNMSNQKRNAACMDASIRIERLLSMVKRSKSLQTVFVQHFFSCFEVSFRRRIVFKESG